VSSIHIYKTFFQSDINTTAEVIHPGESVTLDVPEQIVPELLRKYKRVHKE